MKSLCALIAGHGMGLMTAASFIEDWRTENVVFWVGFVCIVCGVAAKIMFDKTRQTEKLVSQVFEEYTCKPSNETDRRMYH